MRILFLSSHLPLPNISGGRQREYELLRRLSKAHEIDAIIVTKTMEQDRAALNSVRQFFSEVSLFNASTCTNLYTTRQTDQPSQIQRNNSDDARQAVALWLRENKYDLVHAEGYYMVQLVPKASPPLVLVEQNVEFDISSQLNASANEVLQLRRFETRAWKRADRVAFLTDEDATLARSILPDLTTSLAPNGRPEWTPAPSKIPKTRDLIMTANFAYGPSREGAIFFLDAILPIIRHHRPDTSVTFIGSGMDISLRAKCTKLNLDIDGPVPSLTPFFHQSKVAVCSLLSGGGIKMKMLDAVAHGLPIVALSLIHI